MLRTILGLTIISMLNSISLQAADDVTSMGWPKPMSNEEAWKAMPKADEGGGSPLPTWIRMVAREMPRTAAAFLELDLAQRTKSPVEPGLRAAMRYVAAKANGCKYAQATAAADASRAGVAQPKWSSLDTRERTGWSEAEQLALDFAHDMSADSDGVTDEQFAQLVQKFSDRQAASMVLGMAYANFQDRLLNCLGAPMDENSQLAAVAVKFSSEALTKQTTPPPAGVKSEVPGAQPGNGKDLIQDEAQVTWLPYDQLQARLKKQRERATRLPIPKWETFAGRLPTGLMEKPSEIVWYRIAFGYADELAVPFEIYMRTAGAESPANWDRSFGNSLFWMVTDAVRCPYCMGHCEMNWEVVGMTPQQIAELSQKLAGSDWSAFTEPQQQALAFARKNTQTPAKIDRSDIDTVRKAYGDQQAFYICLQTSRYNYMTRISNGFQLTLEKGNPFWDYYRMPTPPAASSPKEESK